MLIVASLVGDGVAFGLALQTIIETLAALDAVQIQQGRRLPALYRSGVRWQPERGTGSGVEEFADPWTCLRRGHGDCDDLTRWRIAECLVGGEQARCRVVGVEPRWHVLVRLASGAIEDPSVILGAPVDSV